VPNLIKIDTDGNEKKILLGGQKVLTDERLRAIIIEMPVDVNEATDCHTILNQSGLKIIDYLFTRALNEIWARV
jgi:hypothetical protein